MQQSDNPPPLPPVFAAMAAQEDARAAHELVAQHLAAAMDEGARADEELRRADHGDDELLVAAARRLSTAVAKVQKLAWREKAARLQLQQAQEALAVARTAQQRTRLEQLRIELEIDAASIWDLVGQFEALMRTRLDAHGQLAAELQFVASVAGEPGAAALAADTLAPALSTSGPELWTAIAGGVRQRHALPAPPPPAAAITDKVPVAAHDEPLEVLPRFDFARPSYPMRAVTPPPPANIPIPIAPVAEADRGRLDRIIRNLSQIVSRPPKTRRAP